MFPNSIGSGNENQFKRAYESQEFLASYDKYD